MKWITKNWVYILIAVLLIAAAAWWFMRKPKDQTDTNKGTDKQTTTTTTPTEWLTQADQLYETNAAFKDWVEKNKGTTYIRDKAAKEGRDVFTQAKLDALWNFNKGYIK